MFVLQFEANHNKDYSVVKTFKAGQLAFFLPPQPIHFIESIWLREEITATRN